MKNKIPSSQIHLGICFNECVYFDDGKNMFLAKNKTAKSYHLAAIKRWKIPYLLTDGVEIIPPAQQAEEIYDELEELDELDEVEELEDVD